MIFVYRELRLRHLKRCRVLLPIITIRHPRQRRTNGFVDLVGHFITSSPPFRALAPLSQSDRAPAMPSTVEHSSCALPDMSVVLHTIFVT